MRLPSNPRLPQLGSVDYDKQLYTQLYKLFQDIGKQVNQLSEGQIQAVTNATAAAPTAGTYQQGDKVWNSAVIELGTAGSKYCILGWVCVAAGSPGTWLQMRTLTGN